jgi:hypothetical protein
MKYVFYGCMGPRKGLEAYRNVRTDQLFEVDQDD